MATARPIIVIKKKGGHGGHHGGAWKVAYADFVTAMMSLFIVLWLMNSTPQIKKAIAGYFNDPRGTSKKMGTELLGSGPTVTIDQTNVKKLEESIKKAIVRQKELEKLADQVELTMTDEGLRIELIDGKNGSFFESGSQQLTPDGQKLLDLIAGQLKNLPNHLLLEGHTDAQPFGGNRPDYTNWELSSDRANSTRRLIENAGVADSRVAQVRGYADQVPRVQNDPLSPANRRISIVVQFQEAPAGTTGPEILDNGDDEGKGGKKEGTGEKTAEAGKPGEAAKAGEGAKTGEAAKSKPSAADAAPPKPDEPQPSTGKIDLPPVPMGAAKPARAPRGAKPSGVAPSGRTSENLGNQLNQMRQMKQADAAGH